MENMDSINNLKKTNFKRKLDKISSLYNIIIDENITIVGFHNETIKLKDFSCDFEMKYSLSHNWEFFDLDVISSLIIESRNKHNDFRH